MITVNATKLMIAFYDDHEYTIARFIETCFRGEKPQHPFTREQTILEGITLVFPELRKLLLPLHSLCLQEEIIPLSLERARFSRFRRWNEISAEDPSTTLIAMDLAQHLEVSPIVWEWQERRFPTIFWSYILELEPTKAAKLGEEPHAKYEVIYFDFYTPEWSKVYQGYVRYEVTTLKPVEVLEIPLFLTQERRSTTP